MKKVIVIGVIALFISVAAQPVFAVENKLSVDNNPPNPPKITAFLFYDGGDWRWYFFEFNMTDPDGDNLIHLAVRWHEHDFVFHYHGNWSSGSNVTYDMRYSRGKHLISAQSCDEHGAWGDWGYLEIEFSKNKPTTNMLLIRLLERLPLLQKLLLLRFGL